jgi:ribonuclease R
MSKKKKKSYESANTFVKSVMEIFLSNPLTKFNYKQVAARLGVSDNASKELVKGILAQLTESGELEESKKGTFQVNKKSEKFPHKGTAYVTGTIDMKQTGKAYVIMDDKKEEDVFISPSSTAHSLHGDRVKVLLFPKRKGKKTEGQVVEILQRNKKQFVGTIEVSRNFAFLIPDNPSMPVHIFIPLTHLNGAKNGQKVVAEITEWPPQSENPFGEVTHVLGMPGNNDVEMDSILAEFEFPLSFSSASEKEADQFKTGIPQEEINKRKDYRNVFTITIDPADAKDFDDAISLKKLENGNWEVGVHIADVSYYVKPGMAIDKEAYQRGTSIYLVDRVIPMLPERLSNQLCSLQPEQDRLCFSAVFELDENAGICSEWFGKTIIHSTMMKCRKSLSLGKESLLRIF